MTDIKFNIASINLCTESEGPFKRLVIWFQGCNKRCVGCCNPDYQELKQAQVITLDKLLQIIEESKEQNKIEGVTFLGGEPTLQKGLAYLAKEIKNMGLGIIMFTGKLIQELDNELFEYIDLIIDGEFIIENRDKDRNVIGSTNQKMYFLTNRYEMSKDWFLVKRPNQFEINIENDNLFINGNVL